MQLKLAVVNGGAFSGAFAPRKRSFISTGCDSLDELLGGGFARGELAEVFGPPASGRTCIACCAAARALASGSSVLYVDADGGVVPSRLRELVGAALSDMSINSTSELVDSCLHRLFLSRVCSWDELAAGIAHTVPGVVDSDAPDTAMVVVDTIALPYRASERSGAQKRLEVFASRMADFAMRANVAVVLINNSRLLEAGLSARRVQGDPCGYPASLSGSVGVAALGDAWAYVCPSRLAVGWSQGRQRRAHLVKSSRRPRASVDFSITSRGIEALVGVSDDGHW